MSLLEDSTPKTSCSTQMLPRSAGQPERIAGNRAALVGCYHRPESGQTCSLQQSSGFRMHSSCGSCSQGASTRHHISRRCSSGILRLGISFVANLLHLLQVLAQVHGRRQRDGPDPQQRHRVTVAARAAAAVLSAQQVPVACTQPIHL